MKPLIPFEFVARGLLELSFVVFVVVGLGAGCLVEPCLAQEPNGKVRIAEWVRAHAKFTTKSGKTYDSKAIQKVSVTGVSVITDSGISRIKVSDLTDDFREFFGLTDEVLKKAQEEYQRKRIDKKRADYRQKKAQGIVLSSKRKIQVEVMEEVEFGFICDAKVVEEVTEVVTKTVRARALDRDQRQQTKKVEVKKMAATGIAEKVLVRGLPKYLRKPGKTWEGEAFFVGTYVIEPTVGLKEAGWKSPQLIPLVFVEKKEALAYRAMIPSDGSVGDAYGSGVAIGKNGYILTSYKLVATADSIEVTISDHDRPVKATIVTMDPKENLAVLKVNAKLKPVPFAQFPSVSLGQEVYTIGYPDVELGKEGRIAKKTTAQVASITGVNQDSRYIQIEGEFEPGNFGGAVYDEFGSVIGILAPNPPESFFLDRDGADYEPLQFVAKSSRFRNLIREVPGMKADGTLSEDPGIGASEAAVLIEVKRKKVR